MIDPKSCVFEETVVLSGETTHYFTYPKEKLEELDFYSENDYGNVVAACISLTVGQDGSFVMQMSPTVEEESGLFDVDWRDLYLGINYTQKTVSALKRLAKKRRIGNGLV